MEEGISVVKQDLQAKDMQSDLLAAATRFVGVGYNYIRGSPEGDFSTGGRDPGVMITKHILKFTHTREKQAHFAGGTMNIPDQVNFQPENSCLRRDLARAYSGAKSYQEELSVATNVGGKPSRITAIINYTIDSLVGSYKLFAFSASSAVREARNKTEKHKQIYIDKKRVCSYGEVRYVDTIGNQFFPLTDEFYQAVKKLPTTYSLDVYLAFIENWGTVSNSYSRT